MPLTVGGVNEVNGLALYIMDNGFEPGVLRPTDRQLQFIERAVNACAFDWNRMVAPPNGAPLIAQVGFLPADILYAGHLGLFSNSSFGSVSVPGVGVRDRAYAPATVPDGSGHGDYGIAMLGGSGVGQPASIYLLNTLDIDAPPYGGPLFFMETLIRLLGLWATRWLPGSSVFLIDKLARCMEPSDRVGFMRNPTFADGYDEYTMYRPAKWFFHSVGTQAIGPEPDPGALLGSPYDPMLPNEIGWGVDLVTTQQAIPWADRALEGMAEAFKDTFLQPRFRQGKNRTNVQLKAGRDVFDEFVACYQDFWPMRGTIQHDDATADIIHPNPAPPPFFIITGFTWDFQEAIDIFRVPVAFDGLPETTALRMVPTPGDPSLHYDYAAHDHTEGPYSSWHLRLRWAFDPPHPEYNDPVLAGSKDQRDQLVNEIVFPTEWLAGNGLVFDVHNVGGADSLLGPEVDLGHATSERLGKHPYPIYSNWNAGGTDLTQWWHHYFVFLPTKGHPAYPGESEVHLHGYDPGRRPRENVVGRETANVGVMPPPPIARYADSGAPPNISLQGR